MGKTHFFIAAAICVSLAASMAHGEAIYSQTPASTVTAIASDRDFDNDGH